MYLGGRHSWWCRSRDGVALCACPRAHGQDLVRRQRQGQAASASLVAGQRLRQLVLFAHRQSGPGGPQRWMWGFSAPVPRHGPRQPQQDATAPPKPCDKGQGERGYGAVCGVLQLSSVHFRTSEESARGGKANHPHSAGVRGHGGESQIHGMMPINSSDETLNSIFVCHRTHRRGV